MNNIVICVNLQKKMLNSIFNRYVLDGTTACGSITERCLYFSPAPSYTPFSLSILAFVIRIIRIRVRIRDKVRKGLGKVL